MNHKAIRAIYSQVVIIDDGTGAFDAQGNKVEIDMALVDAWVDPDTYKFQRAAEYPSIVDQLDKIFHDGIDEWKETIQAVKDKYPKP
jgi:predicted metalloendopeptidase